MSAMSTPEVSAGLMERVMKRHRLSELLLLGAVLIFLAIDSLGQTTTETFQIDGSERRALVYSNSKPSGASGAPVVFVFHGHGGTAQNAARRFAIQKLWPEAVVVYMQGIPGVVGILDPQAVQSSWQKAPGELADRDIRFFDQALERIQKKHHTDPNRVYILGHSNGARFVNVLWNTRGEKLAALCAAAGPGGRLIENARPRPMYIIAGEKDALVPFQTQLASIELARKHLKTDSSKAKVHGFERSETASNDIELVTYVHPAGHELPLEALPGVIAFFQRHVRR